MEEAISINFDENSRMLLNFLLAFIMFGVALDLSFTDIVRAFKKPKPTFFGLLSQFILLPILTFLLISVWQPLPGLALGLFLVAACPGGNISNFMSSLAKADVGLSVSLTAISTLLCLFFTPFNFEFWSGLYPGTQNLLKSVQLDAVQLLKMVFMLLFLPVLAGMALQGWKTELTQRIKKPIRWLSMLVFIGFVIGAFLKNQDNFMKYAHLVALLVLVHNMLALTLGYSIGRAANLGEPASRSLSIETGIQNSGLGLVISFNFFPEIGEMALVCAWWGIWHIISGLVLSSVWSKVSVNSFSSR
ncbi:MAG: bile acid:sodium symporter family protein [Flavobacteriales bacterium]|nr:bile acid:sodium symporter family protein [Flavobacteriales bacterium]